VQVITPGFPPTATCPFRNPTDENLIEKRMPAEQTSMPLELCRGRCDMNGGHV